MEFRNLCPHSLSLVREDGSVLVIEPSSTTPARREVIRSVAESIDGFAITTESLGPVVGLPEPEPGVVLVVSRLVAQGCPGRGDVYIPGELIRDGAGAIVGARGLCQIR